MDRLGKEYIELLSEDVNPSDKFWSLDKRIKEDKRKAGIQLEMSRSNLIYNIISLINEGAISFEDLEEFSDELKETIRAFIGRWIGDMKFWIEIQGEIDKCAFGWVVEIGMLWK